MSVPEPSPSRARFVALGILSSKIFGLVRERVIAHFFGVGPHLDVLRNALRAPNVLQNLLGEQTLSAAFIPIYSRFLAEGRREDAGRFAGAVFGLLVAAVSLLVVLGMLLAPLIVSVLANGFLGDAARVAAGELEVDRYPLTVRAVRVVFPMTGFLVLAAWALGVLNSHRRFLLSYMSPIVWNLSIIGALLVTALRDGGLPSPGAADPGTLERWLFAVFAGGLVGGVLQFGVQLPMVLRLTTGLRPSLSTRVAGVRNALRAVVPAIAGRGVVQLSIYIDMFLANFLRPGAPGALGFAAVLINLPVSVFGMSIAAAELPELSSSQDGGKPDGEAQRKMAERIDRALRQAAFVVCPSVVGYLLFGFLAAGLIFRGGAFASEDNWLVYAILAGYTAGLLASTISRLLQNAFFALRDTRTPAKIATVRLVTSATLGVVLMSIFDRWAVAEVVGLGGEVKGLHFGAVGLSLASSVGAWCELALLRRQLVRKLSALRLPVRHIVSRLLLSLAAALPAVGLWVVSSSANFVVQAVLVLGAYVVLYLGYAWWRRLPEIQMWLGRLRRG